MMEAFMESVKEEVKKMLDALPDDSTYDDILYHIYVREKIIRGMQDIQDNKLIDEAEMDKRFSQWLSVK